MKSPFKFLDPYQFEDYDAFFGREAETKELYNLVTKNRLTFVYGPSGTGKTSLVRCGLANRFGGVDWLPLFIRRGDDINQSLRAAIGAALGEGPGFSGDVSEAVGALFRRYLRPVYLIFDQFEELFILSKNDPEENERQPFYDTVAELLDADLPCRLLFILREDYFGHLNQFEKTVPELYHRKMRVEPMHRDNLRAVVAGSCRVHHIPFGDERRDPDRILDNILADKAGTHMPYVQVYLHMLYQEALRRQYPQWPPDAAEAPPLRFDASVIDGVGKIEGVLSRFLEEQSLDILQRLKKRELNPPDDLVRRVLDPFVSEDGTKVPVRYATHADGTSALKGKAAARLARQDPALVSACLHELEAARILRRSETDYELAHDTLAAIIAGRREAYLQQERDAYNRIELGYKEHQQAQEHGQTYFFDRRQLTRLEPLLPQLALEPAHAAFLEASRTEAERLENEEKERIARQKADAQRRQRRAMWTSVFAAVLILTALGAAWLAYRESEKAARAIKLADQKNRAAEVSDSLAQVKTRAAEVSDSTATVAEQKAKLDRELADLRAKEAQTAADLAEIKKKEAARAALEAVVSLIDAARRDVLSLRYDAAFSKMKKAAGLEQVKDSVAFELMEIAFFKHYAGQPAEAEAACSLAARLLEKPVTYAPGGFRGALATLDRNRDSRLEARYFPDMVDVEGGTFTMGSDDEEDNFYGTDARPPHPVTVSRFKMAKTETTVWQYNLYLAARGKDIEDEQVITRPGWGWEGSNPVVKVSWYEAVDYANWLSRLFGLAPAIDTTGEQFRPVPGAYGFRLPTEAEWEYAARGGIHQDTFPYSGGHNADEVAWHRFNSRSRTNPVAGKKANGAGVYDMSGNVWEWCWDWYATYPDTSQINPWGPDEGDNRVLRGGSWSDGARNCRAADRYDSTPGNRNAAIGFRLVRSF
ncbi:MAG: SUMF1/EgtB/PvdO family nonheme iron enzyme [Saprospiraceae bacterium]|nr:SUMF1/EgtB/PvdO family nonheme iron enzyme [Saprospiraceae bacterium]